MRAVYGRRSRSRRTETVAAKTRKMSRVVYKGQRKITFRPGHHDPKNLYVKELVFECNQLDLDDIFRPYGNIVESRVWKPTQGFVRFETHEACLRAIEALNGYPCIVNGKTMSKQLRVSFAFLQKADRSIDGPNGKPVHVKMNRNQNNVYIRQLPEDITIYTLDQWANEFGAVQSRRLLKETLTAFVRYFRSEDASKAIRGFNAKHRVFAKLANDDPLRAKFVIRDDQSERPDEPEDWGTNSVANYSTTSDSQPGSNVFSQQQLFVPQPMVMPMPVPMSIQMPTMVFPNTPQQVPPMTGSNHMVTFIPGTHFVPLSSSPMPKVVSSEAQQVLALQAKEQCLMGKLQLECGIQQSQLLQAVFNLLKQDYAKDGTLLDRLLSDSQMLRNKQWEKVLLIANPNGQQQQQQQTSDVSVNSSPNSFSRRH